MVDIRKHRWRARWLAFSAFGLAPLGLGFAIVLYYYAVANAVVPPTAAAERRGLILRNMFLTTSVAPTLVGLFLIAAGAGIFLAGAVAFYSGAPPRFVASPRIFFLSAIVVASIAALLFALN